MRSGDGCPLCADAHLHTNAHSDLILELGSSFARLHHNQTHAGYVVVILKDHVCEMHELDPARRAMFWDDVAAVGRAVTQVFRPVKLDSLVMGHRCPHLHCHVYPQYPGDDPLALVDISVGSARLKPVEQQQRIALLQERLRTDL